MTDRIPPLELPPEITAELHAAHARRVSDFVTPAPRHGIEAPQGRRYELWAANVAGQLQLVFFELHPDGSLFLWQPLPAPTTIIGTVDALRAYFAPAP